MAISSMYITKSKYLPQLSVKDGQLIFTTDGNTIALDFGGTRYFYQTIQTLATEEDRKAIVAPLSGYYYVEGSNVLWYYSSSWTRMTPDGVEPIVFGQTEEDFPETGRENVLYVANKALYRYSVSDKKYLAIANLTEWGDLPVQ